MARENQGRSLMSRESRANIGIVTICPCRHLHGIQARLVTSLGKQSEGDCGVECINCLGRCIPPHSERLGCAMLNPVSANDSEQHG
jgi:hypothetical protein